MNEEFEFDKPNRGIVFTTSINSILGSKNIKSEKRVVKNDIERRGDEAMYNLITVIVDKGRAEEVIDAANKAGQKVERSSTHVVQEYMKVARYFPWK